MTALNRKASKALIICEHVRKRIFCKRSGEVRRREIKKLEETMQEATAEKANQGKEFSAVCSTVANLASRPSAYVSDAARAHAVEFFSLLGRVTLLTERGILCRYWQRGTCWGLSYSSEIKSYLSSTKR